MQIAISKLCESSKCGVYSAVNHPWWSMVDEHGVCLVARSHSVILHIRSISLRCDPSWLFNGET